MRRRLNIGIGMVHRPAVLFLDEPTTGLDPLGMKEVRELILELARERGVTIFLSSHLLYEVEMIATWMAIIHQGRLRVGGSVQELLKQGLSAVLVKTDRPDELFKFLEVKDAYRTASLQSDGVRVELDAERIPELNRQLVEAGFNVNALVPQRSLEAYFLNLIEGRET